MSAEGRPERTLPVGYEIFTRERWTALARRSGALLSDSERQDLAVTAELISLDEVADVYLPLAQLLALTIRNRHEGQRKIDDYLGLDRATGPFIIGIAGGVAVGKSTTARVLQVLLRRMGTTDLLTTDGFLWPNAMLEAWGILDRKGFPESYDQVRLVEALSAIRAGQHDVAAPVYSHLSYDIVPGEFQIIRQPDILILEGLNVLQASTNGTSPTYGEVSDYLDASVYVDAAETDVALWFSERLSALRSAPNEPDSFFHRLASLSDSDFAALAEQVWKQVNLVNLRENIAPTRGRAHLIIEKGGDHCVDRVLLRRS